MVWATLVSKWLSLVSGEYSEPIMLPSFPQIDFGKLTLPSFLLYRQMWMSDTAKGIIKWLWRYLFEMTITEFFTFAFLAQPSPENLRQELGQSFGQYVESSGHGRETGYRDFPCGQETENKSEVSRKGSLEPESESWARQSLTWGASWVTNTL